MEKSNRKWTAIDIAKDELELRDDKGSWKHAYTKQALERLTARLKKLKNAWVICEASGGYERDLLGALHAAKIKVCLVSPNRIRAYAISDASVIRVEPGDLCLELAPEACAALSAAGAPPVTDGAFSDAKARAIELFEREYLYRLMSEACGNVSAAARRAGKERRALGKLLKKHGLAREQFQRTRGVS